LSGVARTRYRRLSGGERQRLGLALALVGRPEVVVLDEPTAGMDPEARATTRAIVADLRDDGAAILMTSHDLTDVERLADRIYVLADGRIVASGTPAELRAGVTARLRFRLDRALGRDEVAAMELALAAARPGTTVQPDGDGGRYRLEGGTPDAGLVAALTAWCATAERLILELRTSGGSLEDAYLELVGAPAPTPSPEPEVVEG
jgi:ABC-2 type transport system ATP-binding protein